jgi:hypothetical protein
MKDELSNSHSIVQPGQHFRLRIGAQIVGYMNIREAKSIFYSKDNSSWGNTAIDFDHRDRSTEVFDANRQMIFEHDLIRLRKDANMEYTKRGLVVWHHVYRTLVVKLIEEDDLIMLDVSDPKNPLREDLEVISHLS